MELGEHEGDMGGMPLPMLVSGYGGPPTIHESSKAKPPGMNADHHQNGSAGTGTSSDETRTTDLQPVKKSVRYRECLKNHAASIGGHAIDGCGDFMPSGEEGSLEALKCAACNCHRNFHRREVEGEPPCYYCYNSRKDARRRSGGIGGGGGGGGGASSVAPLLQNAPPPLALPAPSRFPPHQMIMALSGESDDGGGGYMNAYGGGGGGGAMAMSMMKKRFRTKFTSEQKEKMSAFAEKLGWRIQKQDEAAVQQFCIDVGVKRHVLKVWMHNNKSNALAKSNREQCSSQ